MAALGTAKVKTKLGNNSEEFVMIEVLIYYNI